MKNILVTGGTGYIGSKLVNELVNKNSYKIFILTRPSSNLETLQSSLDLIETFEYVDFKSIVNFFKENNIDIVVHLAAYTGEANNIGQVEKSINSNLLLSVHLLEGMRQFGVKKIINTGSYWEFSEEDNDVPNSLYSLLKSTTRQMIKYYHQAFGLNYLNLILYDVYGEDDPRNKIINKLINLPDGSILDMTLGQQKLSFVHIDDVVRGYVKAIQKFVDDDVYNKTFYLYNKEIISLKELVKLIEEIRNEKFQINWGGKPYCNGQIMNPFLGGEPLPGWTSSITIKEGIAKLYKKLIQR